MATNGTNISADVVQTAASWIESPAICITQLQCIIDQFDSLFSVQAYTTSHGEELLIAEETEIKTELPRWKRINELCKSIRVAEKALSLCEKKSPDVFKIDPQWQISSSNLRRQLIKRSLNWMFKNDSISEPRVLFRPSRVPFKVPREKKSPATIDELAVAFSSFVEIVKNLIQLLTLWALNEDESEGKLSSADSRLRNSITDTQASPERAIPIEALQPIWNEVNRTLTIGKYSITFAAQATLITRLMSSFQASNWSENIVRKIHPTMDRALRRLRGYKDMPISFHLSGKYIKWKWKDPRTTSELPQKGS